MTSPTFFSKVEIDEGLGEFKKFIAMMKYFILRKPLLEALTEMPRYAKFMKKLVIKKRAVSLRMLERCTTVVKLFLDI